MASPQPPQAGALSSKLFVSGLLPLLPLCRAQEPGNGLFLCCFTARTGFTSSLQGRTFPKGPPDHPMSIGNWTSKVRGLLKVTREPVGSLSPHPEPSAKDRTPTVRNGVLGWLVRSRLRGYQYLNRPTGCWAMPRTTRYRTLPAPCPLPSLAPFLVGPVVLHMPKVPPLEICWGHLSSQCPPPRHTGDIQQMFLLCNLPKSGSWEGASLSICTVVFEGPEEDVVHVIHASALPRTLGLVLAPFMRAWRVGW